MGLFLGALLGVGVLHAGDGLEARQWSVDGVTREALVSAPAQALFAPAPVLFVFHGHGGTMGYAAKRMAFHELWPEAIVVYPQGLNTPGQLTDPQGERAGWQKTAGDQGDRDLKFFDAMLQTLRKDYLVDERNIFVTGHSNGGAFTYLLWAERGQEIKAVAPTAAAAFRMLPDFKPKPAFIVAGESDPLVRFAWQKATINAVLSLDQCDAGRAGVPYVTRYNSKIGKPVETYIHPGGHEFPAEARPLIVQFFQEQMSAP